MIALVIRWGLRLVVGFLALPLAILFVGAMLWALCIESAFAEPARATDTFTFDETQDR